MTQENKKTFSRDQILQVLSLDSQTIELDATERTMIHKIFNFGDITVDQCMVPLVQLTAIRDDSTLEEAHQLAVDTGFSRFPVFHERMHNIIGILNTFDLLNQPIEKAPLTHLVRPAHYIPSNKKIDDLLKELQKRGLHMGVVVDEYGGTSGLISLEDIIEEIVGEISDEFDDEDLIFSKLDENNYVFEGKTPLKDFYKVIGLENFTVFEDQKGEAETLAGFLLEISKGFPKKNEVLTYHNYAFTIEAFENKRIKQIKLSILPNA